MPTLQEYRDQLERDFEAAKAVVYRIDGALQFVRHLLAQDEPPQET